MLAVPALSDVEKPLISLDALGEDSLGLIILCGSGVVYTTQTGGVYCTHPSAEGVFMPIGTRAQQTALDDVFGGGASSEIDPRQAGLIDEILSRDRATSLLTVDRTRLGESHEAWVFVEISRHPDRFPPLPIIGSPETYADPDSPINQSFSPFFGFGSARGILTWPNSD
jgi:hypothetical protein